MKRVSLGKLVSPTPEFSARVVLGVVTFFVAVLIFACQPHALPGGEPRLPAPVLPANFGAFPGEPPAPSGAR